MNNTTLVSMSICKYVTFDLSNINNLNVPEELQMRPKLPAVRSKLG